MPANIIKLYPSDQTFRRIVSVVQAGQDSIFWQPRNIVGFLYGPNWDPSLQPYGPSIVNWLGENGNGNVFHVFGITGIAAAVDRTGDFYGFSWKGTNGEDDAAYAALRNMTRVPLTDMILSAVPPIL